MQLLQFQLFDKCSRTLLHCRFFIRKNDFKQHKIGYFSIKNKHDKKCGIK